MPRLHACSLLALSLPVHSLVNVEDGHAHPGCIQFLRREPCQQPEGKGSQRHSASVGQSRRRHKEIGLPFRETGNQAHRNACYPSGRRDQRALPEKFRQYIHDLETRCDKSGGVQTIALLKEDREAVPRRVEELEDVIRLLNHAKSIE